MMNRNRCNREGGEGQVGKRELLSEDLRNVLFRDVPEIHKGLAQPFAKLPLAGKSSLELISGDQALTDQDFAKRFAHPAPLPTAHRVIHP